MGVKPSSTNKWQEQNYSDSFDNINAHIVCVKKAQSFNLRTHKHLKNIEYALLHLFKISISIFFRLTIIYLKNKFIFRKFLLESCLYFSLELYLLCLVWLMFETQLFSVKIYQSKLNNLYWLYACRKDFSQRFLEYYLWLWNISILIIYNMH